jgi:hypothetical protein
MVRTTTVNTVAYQPVIPPNDDDQWQRYVYNELMKVSAAIRLLAQGHCEFLNVAPSKPREGDIAGADGTNWNPGGGKGVYGYYSSAWHFLG